MAQNALLKELEEPPAYAFFILTAEQPDSLLQTVRSRCTKFALEPSQAAVSDEEAATLLAPYLSAVAERREDRMMLSAMGLEKTPRRALSGVLGILQAAVRDAISSRRLCRKSRCSLHSASRRRHSPAPSAWNVYWRSTILLMC